MIRNYIKIAWRNLLKNKGFSFINIGGLSVGMAVAILIGLWIYDELSFNKYHQNYNKIAQVMQFQTFNGKTEAQNSLPQPLKKELEAKYADQFEYIIMTSWEEDHQLVVGDKVWAKKGNFMEPGSPEMLSLEMIEGTNQGLSEQSSILLSESTSYAIFGEENPLGKSITIDGKMIVKVTGVYKDLPTTSTFKNLSFIAPFELYAASEKWVQDTRDFWGNNSFQIFVQLKTNTDYETAEVNISNAILDNSPPRDKKFNMKVFLHPMADWHLRSHWENGFRTGGQIQNVWLLGIIGLFVLLLAGINFMNLSTAKSEKRAKEVGIRKAVGSVRKQLLNQFLSESFLVVFISYFFSVALVLVLLPWFNEISSKEILFPFNNIIFWALSIAFIVLMTIFSGAYPAFYLSSFKPITVLKGTFKAGKYAAIPRKALVILQFTVSIVLVIGTILIYKQINYAQNRPLGYDNRGIISIPMNSPEMYGKYEILDSRLKSSGSIVAMAESSSPLTAVWANNGGFSWLGKDPEMDANFSTIWVTHDFGKMVDWKFIYGRDFSREFTTDKNALVINETAARFLNVEDPIGKVIHWGDKINGQDFTVIGIIKDMVMESPYDPVSQTIYLLDYENVNWIHFKLNPALPVRKSLAEIENVFQDLIPSVPFNYEFVDAKYQEKFKLEERISTLILLFSVLAIFISCLGLLGLASFMAEQRTKEIGIRKVLGASVTNLWQMLSKDFVILVLISCLIAAPIAWYFMNEWLQKYTYRTEISWWIFVAAGLGALAITLLTVSYQAVKAALLDPVKSLKTE